jgi:hypothetical protein
MNSELVVISEPEFIKAIQSKLMEVEEFRFIRREAERLGIKAYLFGGTAAGFAHYVHRDLHRRRGDHRFQSQRFDYDFTNIYRSTQDIDIVVDGPPEKAVKLQEILQENFPYFQDSKEAWEVRLLRESGEGKEALLDNPDFLNQHTDSNSIGLIEITKPEKNELVIRDLRDWNSTTPSFTRDILEETIHFYFSSQHKKTSRYLDGTNPPIFSVIRYLTKAFQYNIKTRADDESKIKEILHEFDPHRDLVKRYTQERLEFLGKKLFKNASNIEYAWNKLEELGLRRRLIEIKNNSNEPESLAWWLNREPLRTFDVGIGAGITAEELAKERGMSKLIVSHETINFSAYESITRSEKGEPNALISREGGFEGEVALYGDGFYVQIGMEGAIGTGFTVRFEVDPKAREGSDFIFSKVQDHLIFRNKAVLRIMPESLNLGIVKYFSLLAHYSELQTDDLEVLEKLRRHIPIKMAQATADQISEVHDIILDHLNEKTLSKELFIVWFSQKISRSYYSDLYKIVQHPQGIGLLGEVLFGENPKKTVSPWLQKHLSEFIESAIDGYLSDGYRRNSLDFFRNLAAEKRRWKRQGIEYGSLTARQRALFDWVLKLEEAVDSPESKFDAKGLIKPIKELKDQRLASVLLYKLQMFVLPHLKTKELIKVKSDLLDLHDIKFVSDWDAMSLLLFSSREPLEELNSSFYLKTRLWVSRDWTDKERRRMQEALSIDDVIHRKWLVVFVLSQIQSRRYDEMGQLTPMSSGQAWKTFESLPPNGLFDLSIGHTDSVKILEIVDPNRWDQGSIGILRDQIAKKFNSLKPNSFDLMLVHWLLLPIAFDLPEVRNYLFTNENAVKLVDFLEGFNPQWNDNTEAFKTRINAIRRNPLILRGLSFPGRFQNYEPTPTTHQLLELILKVTGTKSIDSQSSNQQELLVDMTSSWYMFKSDVLFQPQYLDLLPEALKMLKRLEKSGKNINLYLEVLKSFADRHPEVIRDSLDFFRKVSESDGDEDVRLFFKDLVALVNDQKGSINKRSNSETSLKVCSKVLN